MKQNQFNPGKRGVSDSREKDYFNLEKQEKKIHANIKSSQSQQKKIDNFIKSIDHLKKQQRFQQQLKDLLADLLQNELQRKIRKNLQQKSKYFFQSKKCQQKLTQLRLLGQDYLSLLNYDSFYPQSQKSFKQKNIEQRKRKLQELINGLEKLFNQNGIKAEYTELRKYVISGQCLVSMFTDEKKKKILQQKIRKYAAKRGSQFLKLSKIIQPLLIQVFDDLLSIYPASKQEKFGSMIHVCSEQIIKKAGKSVQKRANNLASSLEKGFKGFKSLFKF